MIRHAKKEDADSCIRLLDAMKEDYAAYRKKSFKEDLMNSIEQREVFVSLDDDTLEGFVMFDRKNKELTMLAVHPDYRNQSVATKLIYTVAGCFEPEDEIKVTAYGNEEQIEELKGFYYSCGFEDDEDCTDCNAALHRFVYRV
ncbi:GNAT family N-acetyltransferase [Merdibacter massiliensis]|uniref:GNAT family N-acetyltransferase n=1 Tax=Merdibacter massiliensis TaxID=1871030 RepID=UPI00096AB614|nr:GNAT family N-acetyltransferase [Merdibacter massiliensis]